MTKAIWTATCSAIVGIAVTTVIAQAPASQQTKPSDSDQRIIVTGCLTQGTPSSRDATGTAGTAGAHGAAGTAGAAGDARPTDAAGVVAARAPAANSSESAPGSERDVPVVRLESGKTLAAACGQTASAHNGEERTGLTI